MVRRKNEAISGMKNIRGGNGDVGFFQVLNGEEEMYGKGRLFNVMTLQPGVSIGEHTHQGDNEIYYIISGESLYIDNGVEVQVSAGDVCICNDGESHAMVNNSSEPCSMVALILY